MNRRIPLAAAAAAGGGGMLTAAFLSTAVAVADSGNAADLTDNVFTIGEFTFDPGSETPSIEPLFSMPPLLSIGGAGGFYDAVGLLQSDTTVGELLDSSGLGSANLSDMLDGLSFGDLLNENAQLGTLLNDSATIGDLLNSDAQVADLLDDNLTIDSLIEDVLGDHANDNLGQLVDLIEVPTWGDSTDGDATTTLGDLDVGAAAGKVLTQLDIKGGDGKGGTKGASISLTVDDALQNLGLSDQRIDELLAQVTVGDGDNAQTAAELAQQPLLQALGLDDLTLGDVVDEDAAIGGLLNEQATLGDLINSDASLGDLINQDVTIGDLAGDLLGAGIEDQTVGELLDGLLPDTGTDMQVYDSSGDLVGMVDTVQNVSNIFGIHSAAFTITDVSPVGDAGVDDLPTEGAVYSVTDIGFGFSNVYHAVPTDGGAEITDTLITPFGNIDLSTPFNALADLMPASILAGTDTSGGSLFGGLFGGLDTGGSDAADTGGSDAADTGGSDAADTGGSDTTGTDGSQSAAASFGADDVSDDLFSDLFGGDQVGGDLFGDAFSGDDVGGDLFGDFFADLLSGGF